MPIAVPATERPIALPGYRAGPVNRRLSSVLFFLSGRSADRGAKATRLEPGGQIMAKEPEKLWGEVDRYFTEQLRLSDPVLDAATAANRAAKLPAIDVAPNQGRFLELLVALSGARKILEIGTLGGYSAICMARALPPGGRVISLEYDSRHAEVAQANIQRARLADRIEIRIGAALESLPRIEKEGAAPFDFIFIDA